MKMSKGVLSNINVRRKIDLAPKCKHIYTSLNKLKKRNAVLKTRYKSVKERVTRAEKFYTSHTKELEKLNCFTQNFIASQIRTQPLKPRGRRFTIDDKIFALSLFKQSGKAYRMLSKVFALPSKKSILDLLRKIPFEPGINHHIFENLKKHVNKIKNKLDRYCTIIFDEISLSSGLQYMSNKDEVIGFQDLGNGDRSSLFADKALVFMVRGVRKTFKQPVSYMLANNSVKSPNLSVAIKDVIKAIQGTGLKVVSIICDQAQANVSAINILMKETEEKYLRLNKEKRNFGFEIGNDEIVPLFDAPHLLKGIRNNLLTKNLKFKKENTIREASWSHIRQFYELDINQSTIGDRLTPKLTDSHIYVGHMKKMKVSYAAQIFSQRVGSIMKMLAQWSRKYFIAFCSF